MFKAGDIVRLKKSGKVVKIISQASVGQAVGEGTIWKVQPIDGGNSLNVRTEEIEAIK